jgi:hypothetical protein
MRLRQARLAMPAIPKCGPGPGRNFGVDCRSPRYCHVTFDHPPIDTITATTVAERTRKDQSHALVIP